jgi:energy-coupling factor transporter ATP-binding protein EcfA2
LNEPIIHIKNLTFTYAGLEKPSIKNINFNAYKGEFIVKSPLKDSLINLLSSKS